MEKPGGVFPVRVEKGGVDDAVIRIDDIQHLVPPGGASVMEFQPKVPGNYTLYENFKAVSVQGCEGVVVKHKAVRGNCDEQEETSNN